MCLTSPPYGTSRVLRPSIGIIVQFEQVASPLSLPFLLNAFLTLIALLMCTPHRWFPELTTIPSADPVTAITGDMLITSQQGDEVIEIQALFHG